MRMKMKVRLLALVWSLALLLISGIVHGQTTPVGTETKVNGTVAGNQRAVSVSTHSDNRYAVVWESEDQDTDGGTIVLSAYHADGSTFIADQVVNTTTVGSQSFPDVSFSENGNIIVTWMGPDADGWGVFMRGFDGSGSQVIAETAVNATTTGNQRFPKVASNHAGGFVITWEGNGDIIGQRFTSLGVADGAEFTINATTKGNQLYPDVAMDRSGDFVVVWQSDSAGGNFDIHGQLFTPVGATSGSEFLVNQTRTDHQLSPAVDMDSTGAFVVVWESNLQDGDASGIYGRRFSNTSAVLADEFLVNTTTAGAQVSPAVTLSFNGIFMASWTSFGQDGDQGGIYYQVFKSDGEKAGTELKANTRTTDYQILSSLSLSLDEGVAMMAWQDGRHASVATHDGDQYGIYSQRYQIGDITNPVAIGMNLNVYLDATGNATVNGADYDNGSTDANGVTFSVSKSAWTCADLGENDVVFTASDPSDNQASLNLKATVLDTISPVINVQSINLYLDASGNASLIAADLDNGTTDNCQLASLALSKTAYTCADVGLNNPVFTATDASGNASTVLAAITVLDTISPTTVAQDVTLYLDASGNGTITPADVDNGSSDICGITSLALSKTAFTCADLGANNVNLTATDHSGNAKIAPAVITVLDTISPTLTTQNINLYLDASGNGTLTAADLDNGSTDNCGISSLVASKTSFNCSELGANSVTLTATDASGNTKAAAVTVTALDTISPVVITQDLTLTLDGTGTVSITPAQVDNGSSDNCSIANLTLDKTTFTSDDIGNNTVILQITDGSGNSKSATATITVQKGDQTITFGTLANRAYGDADFNLTASSSSGLGVTYTSSNPAVATVSGNTVTVVGVGSTSITASQAGDPNFNAAADVVQTLTVVAAVLTVTADNQSKTYGDANPAFTVSYSGFVNGESEGVLTTLPTATSTADATTAAGSYAIVAAGAVDSNYTFNYLDGTLTINQATLTVMADDQNKTYGDANPVFTVTYSGFQNGDTESVLDTAPTASSTADATSSVGTYAINAAGGVDNNYTFSYVAGTFTINQATLTVTADDQGKTYGAANPVFTVTYSGFQNGDAESVLDTPPTASSVADASSAVGTYAINATGGTDNNYAFTYIAGTLTINQATLTVTADDQSKTYGDANPAFTVSYSGFQNGDTESVLDTGPTASSATDATTAVGTYTIDVAGGTDNNYAFNYVAGTLTINQATLTVTANDQSKTYGDANPVFTVSYSGFQNGDTESVLDTAPTASSTADATTAVGSYTINVAGGTDNNYAFSYVVGTLTINQASLTVTADDQSKTYGDVNPAFTVSYSGFQNGDTESVLDTAPTASSAADATSSVGTYGIVASGGADNNYTFSYVAGTLTINQATLTVTADDQVKTYGDANPAFTVSYSGFQNGDTESVLDTAPTASSAADATSSVGTYGIVASGGADNNYTFSYVAGTLTISQATLTVTADDQVKTYGDANPAFTVSYSGFQNGDSESVLDTAPTASSATDATSSVGTYSIDATGGTDNNYTFSYVVGTLTINQALLSVTADDQVKTYGNANPAFTVSYSGFRNGDTESVLDTAPTASSTADALSSVGTYAITATGGLDNNYSFSYVAGTLTINQATLTVTADDQSRMYGEANPVFTVSYSGFRNGDTESVLDTAPIASSTADATSSVGTYAITAAGGVDNNYTFTYTAGTLTITQAFLVVTADDKSKTYGDANPVFTVTYAGFLNGDTEAVLDTPPTANSPATVTSPVGTYGIVASGGTDNNYIYTFFDGTLTINQATLIVTADDQSKTYGEANPAFSVSYSGFRNGDTESVLDTAPTASSSADATSSVGTYAIDAVGGTDNNYTFSYVAGTLTINQAVLTVTADDQSKTYGEANPAFTVSYSGFQNGDTDGVLDTSPAASSLSNASSAVGMYAINASGGVDNNYTFTYVAGTLTINQATLTVTADDKSKTYGDANPTFTVSYSGFQDGDSESVLDAAPTANSTTDATSSVGTYTIAASGGSDNNYAFSYVAGTLTISQATLTVTADDQSKVYGEVNPTLTVTFSGFLNGDDETVLTATGTATTVADETSDAGTYAITASGVSGDNYTISYVDGTLSITQAVLTVTVDDKSKIYGDTEPIFTVSYSGFQNGDTENVLDMAPAASSATDATSNVGVYVISAAGGSDNNYSFSYVDGSLTVNQAPLTISIDGGTSTYGSDPLTQATLIYDGFVNGDDATVLDELPTITTTATAASPVGDYAATLTGGTDNNYAFTLMDGTLAVIAASLTVTVQDASRTYGSDNPTFAFNYDGFVNGEDVAVVTSEPVAITTADVLSDVGSYAITASGGEASNYTLSFVDGTLVVTQATLVATADDLTKAFGEANPELTATYTGFANGDDSAVLDVLPTINTDATDSSIPGTYVITLAEGIDNNYAFEYTDGTLTVTQTEQAITFEALPAVTFGQADFELTATASSGLEVSFSSSDQTVATISGNVVTIVGGGTVDITASQAGDDNYLAATSVVQTMTVNKTDQTISFGELPEKTFGNANFSLNASTSSGLAVTYSSSDESVATVSGNIISIVGAGTATVTATQVGNDNYNAATEVQQVLVVNKADQEITFEALEDKLLGDSDFDLTSTVTSGLAVTYTSSDATVATINGSTVTLVGVGATTITAIQTGDANYNAATAVEQVLSVSQLNDTRITSSISINPISDQQVNAGSITLTADIRPDTAKVIYEIISGPATISGDVLTIGNEAGIVKLMGTIAETATYKGSEDVIEFAVVDPVLVTPVISFLLPATGLVSDPIPLIATVDALGATTVTDEDVVFEVVSGPGQIIGDFLGFTGTGVVIVSASLPATAETNAVVSQSSVEVVALYSVSGTIRDDQGSAFSDGFVVIADLNDVTNSQSASINADGSYAFFDLPSGDYELFITPFDVNFVLTFFGDVSPVLDPDAVIPALNVNSDLLGVDVMMQVTPPPAVDILSDEQGGTISFQAQNVIDGGNRFIQGRVEMGDPLPNTLVILKTIDDEYVDAEVTDDLGFIEFKGLPTGDYKLVLDIPGVGEISATVGIEEGQMLEVTALIDDEGALLEVDQVLNTVPQIAMEVRAYPNPVMEQLWVEFPGYQHTRERMIKLFDLDGRLVMSIQSNKQKEQLDVRDITPGVIVLQIQEGNQLHRKRILKLR